MSRIEADGSVTTLAEAYRGKRLNSPNDLVYRSDGTLYFTDEELAELVPGESEHGRAFMIDPLGDYAARLAL